MSECAELLKIDNFTNWKYNCCDYLWSVLTKKNKKNIGKEVDNNTTERHDLWHLCLKEDSINKSECPWWK